MIDQQTALSEHYITSLDRPREEEVARQPGQLPKAVLASWTAIPY
jgi:hypothetical protein